MQPLAPGKLLNEGRYRIKREINSKSRGGPMSMNLAIGLDCDPDTHMDSLCLTMHLAGGLRFKHVLICVAQEERRPSFMKAMTW